MHDSVGFTYKYHAPPISMHITFTYTLVNIHMMKMTKSLVFCVLVLLLLCSAFADEQPSQTKVEKDPVAEEEPKQINQGGGGRYCGPRGCNQGGGGGSRGSYCGRRGCCGGYYWSRGQQVCRHCCGEQPKQINQGEVEPATENVKNSNLDIQDHGGKDGGQDHGGKGGGQDHGGKGGGQDHGGKQCHHGCCSGSGKGKGGGGCSYCCRSAEEAKAFKASQGEQEPKN